MGENKIISRIYSLLLNVKALKEIKDNKGMLFSTDLLLSLVVITVTIGISANAMDQVGGIMQDYSSRSTLERSVVETVDILIKTPGSPDNWENCTLVGENYNGISPGLAKINQSNKKVMPGTLSYQKIAVLQKNYDKIIPGRLFPSHIESSMAIYPINPQLASIIVKNEPKNIKSPEIVVVNRTIQYDVMCDYVLLFINTDPEQDNCSKNHLIDTEKTDICPHEILNNNSRHFPYESNLRPYWICKHFSVNLEDLNKTDYYLISDNSHNDPSIFGVLDTADNSNDEKIYFNSLAINLNEKILKIGGNQSKTTIWFHLFVEDPQKLCQVYIVGVPKNTPREDIKIENFQLQPAYFVFKSWIKT